MKMILNDETRERDVVILIEVVPDGKLEERLMSEWENLTKKYNVKKSSVALGCFGVFFRNDPIHMCNRYEVDFNTSEDLWDFHTEVGKILWDEIVNNNEAFDENYEVLFVERKVEA